MKVTPITSALLLVSTIPAVAEENPMKELELLPHGVTDLSRMAGQDQASMDLFTKTDGQIDLRILQNRFRMVGKSLPQAMQQSWSQMEQSLYFC